MTDFNIWDSLLSEEEMVEITGCRAFPQVLANLIFFLSSKYCQGNLLSWEGVEWHLNSTRGTARREDVEVEGEVCRPPIPSLALLPLPSPFSPVALHACTRVSGQVVTYSTTEQMGAITSFLTRFLTSSHPAPGRST